MFYFRQLGP